MAQAVPVVSTAVLRTRDVLAAGAGALVSAEEVEAFAAHVLHRAELGEAGRAHARERWSAEACAARLAALYAEVRQSTLNGATPLRHLGLYGYRRGDAAAARGVPTLAARATRVARAAPRARERKSHPRAARGERTAER